MPESKRLTWDETGKKLYHTGVSKVALYTMKSDGTYNKGVAWNGITAVNESPSGGETTDFYANNSKYLGIRSAEKYEATIEAYMYPDEWMACDGSATIAKGVTIRQQKRVPFGLVYTTILGNDTDGDDYGEIIHIVYGASAAPSSRDNGTVNETPEPSTMSWSVSSNPVPVTGHKPTSTLEIDTTTCDAEKLAVLIGKLYGTDDADPEFLLPDEIAAIFGTDLISG